MVDNNIRYASNDFSHPQLAAIHEARYANNFSLMISPFHDLMLLRRLANNSDSTSAHDFSFPPSLTSNLASNSTTTIALNPFN
ncbi:hypothetical protein Csa_009255, partial [Cucumis sativus]